MSPAALALRRSAAGGGPTPCRRSSIAQCSATSSRASRGGKSSTSPTRQTATSIPSRRSASFRVSTTLIGAGINCNERTSTDELPLETGSTLHLKKRPRGSACGPLRAVTTSATAHNKYRSRLASFAATARSVCRLGSFGGHGTAGVGLRAPQVIESLSGQRHDYDGRFVRLWRDRGAERDQITRKIAGKVVHTVHVQRGQLYAVNTARNPLCNPDAHLDLRFGAGGRRNYKANAKRGQPRHPACLFGSPLADSATLFSQPTPELHRAGSD